VAPFGYGHFDSYNERNEPKLFFFADVHLSMCMWSFLFSLFWSPSC